MRRESNSKTGDTRDHDKQMNKGDKLQGISFADCFIAIYCTFTIMIHSKLVFFSKPDDTKINFKSFLLHLFVTLIKKYQTEDDTCVSIKEKIYQIWVNEIHNYDTLEPCLKHNYSGNTEFTLKLLVLCTEVADKTH